jgi:hypothetical protein
MYVKDQGSRNEVGLHRKVLKNANVILESSIVEVSKGLTVCTIFPYETPAVVYRNFCLASGNLDMGKRNDFLKKKYVFYLLEI